MSKHPSVRRATPHQAAPPSKIPSTRPFATPTRPVQASATPESADRGGAGHRFGDVRVSAPEQASKPSSPAGTSQAPIQANHKRKKQSTGGKSNRAKHEKGMAQMKQQSLNAAFRAAKKKNSKVTMHQVKRQRKGKPR